MGINQIKVEFIIELRFIAYLVSRVVKYSSAVMTGIPEFLKSFPFLVINILQSAFIAQ
jgi:hypothetical protein